MDDAYLFQLEDIVELVGRCKNGDLIPLVGNSQNFVVIILGGQVVQGARKVALTPTKKIDLPTKSAELPTNEKEQ